MKCCGAIESVGCAAWLLCATTTTSGCSIYEELSLRASDAARDGSSTGAPTDSGGGAPETTADAEPHEAGVFADSRFDVSEGDTGAPADAKDDGRPTTSLDAGDAGVDEADDHADGGSDDPDGAVDDVVDASGETSDAADTSFDLFPETGGSSDVADGNDVDVGGPDDAADTGPTGSALIDDMEDNDSFILSREGRHGVWFIVNDGTPGGVQTPGTPFAMSAIPAGRDASVYAARSSGYGFASWRPLMGFWFNHPPAGPKQFYDVRRYRGITFFARFAPSDAGAVSPSVRVVVPDRSTDPDGMVCTGGGCNDHFGVNIVLTPEWRSHTFLFASMTQEGWGTRAPQFDTEHAYGVEFAFPVQASFDCWIDDIAFVP